jgi:glycerol kinase
MRGESGVRPRTLRVDGGATSNGFLMQFQADLLGATIERPAMAESTGLGAGLLAGIGAGLWKDRDAVPAPEGRVTIFRPRLDAAARRRLLQGWDAAVSLLTRASS